MLRGVHADGPSAAEAFEDARIELIAKLGENIVIISPRRATGSVVEPNGSSPRSSRIWSDVALVSDDRHRPDASGSSLDQFRVRAGLSLTFGSGADRTPLPPARRTGQ